MPKMDPGSDLDGRSRGPAASPRGPDRAPGTPPGLARQPCAAPPARPGWADLKSAIRAHGRYDRTRIMRLALARARDERDAFDRMGLPQPWPTLFAHELRLTWQVAKTAMDGLIAERIRARLDAAERAARTLELRAELLVGAIPPRAAEAAGLRAQAQARRQGDGTIGG